MFSFSANNNAVSATHNNGDAFIANYLLAYCFGKESVAVGAVGAAGDEDVVVLQHLVRPGANLVVLNCDHSAQGRSKLNAIAQSNMGAQGGRVTVVDLAQDERWANLLEALALSDVGIIGFDAAWAAKFPGFWSSLTRYLKGRRCVAYIRGIFSYRDPASILSLLKSMPDGEGILTLASTKNGSLWICCNPDFYHEIRDQMLYSGLFEASGAGAGVLLASGRYENAASDLLNAANCLPHAVYGVEGAGTDNLELRRGWNDPEEDGRWTEGSEAEFAIKAPPGGPSDGELRLVANAWLSPLSSVQTIQVSTDPTRERWTSVRLDVDSVVTIAVPYAAADIFDGELEATIRISEPGRPSDHGGSDSRLLGLKLRSVMLYLATAASTPD